ncbi:unnamed protein product [Ophioblennius macclurei]
MIESNISLEVSKLQAALSFSNLQVTDVNGKTHTVTLEEAILVGECTLIGDETTCNCSKGYVWSNEVCYNFNCCREAHCMQNISYTFPLCVPKVQVVLTGSMELGSDWAAPQLTMVEEEMKRLNALENIIVNQGSSNTIAEFTASLGVKPSTVIFEDIIMNLEMKLVGSLMVDVEGIVEMDAPLESACYMSNPEMVCKLTIATEKASWKLNSSSEEEEVELSDGTVVKINPDCSTTDYPSCVAVRLVAVTSVWAGLYTCEFVKGIITYKSKSVLNLAQLPDDISMSVSPLSAECSTGSGGTTDVIVTALIPPSPENYEVWYSYNGERKSNLQNTTGKDQLIYKFNVAILCQETLESQSVEISFKNHKDQIRSSVLEVPVVYDGEKFCEEDIVDGDLWPKTPYKATVTNQSCPEGRTGYKSRTCEGPNWMDVFYHCVNEQLNTLLGEAEKFLKGQGSTSEIAKGIFQELKNSSTFSNDNNANTADVDTSIDILDRMALASRKTVLQDDVLPAMVDAASQILNTTWTGINTTVRYDMSAHYLEAVEMLVENINTNRSRSLKSDNLELKICPNTDCNVTVFDIEVSLNRSVGRPKILAVRNLTPKLDNTYPNTEKTDLLLSATLGRTRDENGTMERRSSFVEIHMQFPLETGEKKKPICVFWNITTKSWSDEGCVLRSRGANSSSCHCNHLTSFSVLMAKGDISTAELDIITSIGLGVSLCCLLIFLLIEMLVWSAVVKTNLSHFRHTAIVNIATFRLLADCSFLASSSPETLSDGFCLAFTVAKHLFYTAMFCWMLCLSVMLVHQLIFVFSPLRKRVFMLLSSIIGYLVPIVIVGSSYVYYRYTYKPYYDTKTCWLNFERLLEGSIHAFLIPVGFVLLINIFSMVVVIVTLVKTQKPDSGKADDKETAKGIIKVLVVLAPVFGVTWVIGFFLLILDHDNPMFPVANYAFTILNSFQGLFIMFAGCIAEQKVREEVLKIITGKGRSDASKSVTSTAYTKDK